MSDGVTITGIKELDEALSKLADKEIKNAGRAAVRAGGSVIIKAARKKLPGNYKTLKKSIGQRLPRPKKRNLLISVIGPRTGKKEKNDGFYAHIVEYGTLASREKALSAKTKRKRKYPDGLPQGLKARPFMRPAYDENKGKVSKAVTDKLWERIKKFS